MRLSIIVPAHNEEAYLDLTLDSVHAAAELLRVRSDVDIETIVVDNDSNDETATVARAKGAKVVREPLRSIARARNTGVRHSSGDVLVFVDADVILPPTVLHAIHTTMSNPQCVGGGVGADYRPRCLSVRIYLRAWGLLGLVLGMVQGATQFCRKSVFEEVGGYDESVWIGEDVDFYWELKKLTKDGHRTVKLIREPVVRPSCRRFDIWPMWKILIWTNPLFIALFRRWKPIWKGWYSDAVR